MEAEQDLVKSKLQKLTNHKFVWPLVVSAIVVIGLSTFTSSVTTLIKSIESLKGEIKFYSSFDQALFNQTEKFYQDASVLISKAKSASPKLRESIKSYDKINEHPAHVSQLERTYESLIIGSDVLLLRAISNGVVIDDWAKITKVNELIDVSLPSMCKSTLESHKLSLSAKNYIDLKCLILNWREQHKNAPDSILKKVNWESRQAILFQMLIIIQKYELSKKYPNNTP
jgi:hypothetical protein